MKIITGGAYGEPRQVLTVSSVEFVAEDGRTMFDVHVNPDGASLTVTASTTCRVGGVLFDSRFAVIPQASNSVAIRAIPWKDGSPA